ncbi:MAG: SDR family oxidoreductase [Acidobacteriota bacterium]|nr:SDR family oxidoreductase [Acidobacteriota bacterium]MDH3524787.1 SDR family oxidoreductase [Acidobacteriota bacterium]
MRILVTGNMGYVGPGVVRRLRESHPQAEIVGFDAGYFAHCLTNAASLPERVLDRQIFGDIRSIAPSLLEGFDAVVNLAAISNDVMGAIDESLTMDVNCDSGVRLAEMAKQAGARSFVFASSCSVYGSEGEGAKTEAADLDPLTAYARSKIATEKALKPLAGDGFNVTCLRFGTACGMSDRLRLDLVLNDFVACAVASKKITVLSDGSPWRPLIHVLDMARAIDWAVGRDAKDGGAFLVCNTGSDAWNYQVRELAEAVAREIPGTEVEINREAPPDNRSYRVDFAYYRRLAPQHQPQVDLDTAVKDLRAGLAGMRFSNGSFRDSELMRIKALTGHRDAGRLTPDLRWTARR